MATSDPPSDTSAKLAQEHDAVTLARALVARLRADGKPEAADIVSSMIAKAGFVNPNPPDPHRQA